MVGSQVLILLVEENLRAETQLIAGYGGPVNLITFQGFCFLLNLPEKAASPVSAIFCP